MKRVLLLLAAGLALAGCVTDDESTATGDEGPGSSLQDTPPSPQQADSCPYGQGQAQVCPTAGAPGARGNQTGNASG